MQKPKKKKEETNGAADAKNGKEAKPKKTKTKKSEETSKEESDAVQSEAGEEKSLSFRRTLIRSHGLTTLL